MTETNVNVATCTTPVWPPFNPDAECVKCGKTGATIIWYKGTHNFNSSELKQLFGHTFYEPECCEREFLFRRCQRCRYAWIERTRDA